MRYYPVTPAEIGAGAARALLADPHNLCTVPVRTEHEFSSGQFAPMLAWGSPMAYEIRVHAGFLYAVFKYDDDVQFLLEDHQKSHIR